MKNKVVILISVIALLFVIVLVVRNFPFNNSDDIKNLLNEKYGENFDIVHDNGNEYEGGVLPSFKKTGYKNVIAVLDNKEEIKFNVRLKLDPLEIAKDDYISANIAYNTSKKIESEYKIGTKMYVHTSISNYEGDGKIADSLFDDINGKGTVSISIYAEGLSSNKKYTEELNGIIKDLNLDSDVAGTIRLYSIKDNGVEIVKDYYKNSKDLVNVESGDVSVRNKLNLKSVEYKNF